MTIFSYYIFKVYKDYPLRNSAEIMLEIQKFSDRVGESSKIKSVEKEMLIDNKYKVVMFKNNENKVALATLKKSKLFDRYRLTHVEFNGNQGYSQIGKSKYFVVYGEKPDSNYKKVKVTIETYDENNEVIHDAKTLNVDKGKYYLQYATLPDKAYPSVVLPEKYTFLK